MKSLAKNTLFNMVYSVANLLFPIVTSMYVSRILLPEGMGQVTYAQNIVSYFVVFSSLGIPTYGVREMAKVRENPEKKNKLFTELFLINAAMTAISVAVFLGLVFAVDAFAKEKMLFLCCGIQLLMNSINIDWLYKGYEEYAYIAIRSLVIKTLSVGAVFLCIHTRQDYVIYGLISSIAAAGNHIFNLIHARTYVKLDFRGLQFKRHMQPILILAMGVFFGTIYAKLDITMLGSMMTKDTVGFYSSAHRLVDMVINVCISASAVFLPSLSMSFGQDKELFTRHLNLGIRVLCLLVPPVYVGINLVAPQAILLVYGENFAPAIATIRLMSFLILVKSFGDLLCYQVAIATGNEKKRLPAYVVAALLNVVLNFLLIPRYAQNGAAIASIASEVVLNGYLLFAMYKIVKFHFDRHAVVQSVVSTGLMALGVWMLNKLQINMLVQFLLMIGTGVCIYVLANLLMKNEILMRMLEKFLPGKQR